MEVAFAGLKAHAETEVKRGILYRPFLHSCNMQTSNRSTTFAKGVNDVRDDGLSVTKTTEKWEIEKSTLQNRLHIHPPNNHLLCTPNISRSKPISIHTSNRKHDKHAAGWLTHQFTSSFFVEKCCFVDVRKLGQVYVDWAT